MTASKTKWVRLGDYIEEVDVRNTEGKYGVSDVRGISVEKKLIETKADLAGVSLAPYKVVTPSSFVYVTVTSRNSDKISLAFNDDPKTYIVSSSYSVFRVTEHAGLNAEYLFMLLSREEFDRYTRFHSWGSARETFDWDELARMLIPLPSLEVQRDVVDSYNRVNGLAEDNEALIAPLTEACEALVADCKRKYPLVQLGDFIEEYKELNLDNRIKIVKSVSVTKELKDTNAKVDKSNLSGYKVVPPSYITYVQTTKNEKCFACAVNNFDYPIVVTSVNRVFRVMDERLNTDYLFLFLLQKEFDRYAIFHSWGSARETFDWEELCRVEIPLPPLEVQQSIARLSHCIEEARAIAREAREQLQTLAPALIRKAIEA